jgi:SAM-dependent methyltransferase
MSPAILDVRSARDFEAGHLAQSANIPLEELAWRVHELPPRNIAIVVADKDPARAQQAVDFLTARSLAIQVRILRPEELTESGPTCVRLWQPTVFLVEALAVARPAASLRSIDLACGTGRDAVYLATFGHQVHAIDILPDALDRARDLAARNSVRIETKVQDLERNPTLPRSAYDLVTVFRFLHRPLLPAIRDALVPGGFVIYETFHVRNLETNLPPRNPNHLLETGELARAFDGFDILINNDAFERDGRYFSQLLARRPQC